MECTVHPCYKSTEVWKVSVAQSLLNFCLFVTFETIPRYLYQPFHVGVHNKHYLCYLAVLHHNQPSLKEDGDSFGTTTSNNATGLILHQHSERTVFSITHILRNESLKIDLKIKLK